MPGDNREAREALRSLLLPTHAPAEQQALETAIQVAVDAGVAPQDFASVVHYEAEDWRSTGKASPLLTTIVQSFIQAQGATKSADLARQYFKLHSALQKKGYLLDFDQASAFLSHVYLMIDLADGKPITASQIARVLTAHDQRAPFSRQSVTLILSSLNLSSDISEAQINDLYELDRELSIQLLADAELSACSKMVSDVGRRLGLETELDLLLDSLVVPEKLSDYSPYLQILHYQCSLTEYFDFSTTDLYEFNPRGGAALALFAKYPAAINKAGNPFLNNAKSVEQITLAWARSKKPNYFSGAKSLYYLVANLNSLGFSARRELCFWIRLWLHRIILLHSYAPTQLPSPITQAQAERLINFVNTGNTESSGVIEQRIVDAGAKTLYPDEKIWKPRGLEDSVNATNISRKKLGDCDFQDSDNHTVVAYEAHGGKLTDIYFKEHIRTLKKILPYRIEEWETFSEVADWTVEVIFVAHEIALDPYEPFEIEGVTISLEAITFEAFLNSCDLAQLTESIDQYVMKTLSENRVPETIRQKVLDTINE
jgi:hypothetical protein